MNEVELTTVALIASTLGGAWGAYRSGSRAWIGAAVMLLSAVATSLLALLLGLNNLVLAIVINFVLVGILGGAMKMTGKQIGYTLLSAFLVVLFIVPLINLAAQSL